MKKIVLMAVLFLAATTSKGNPNYDSLTKIATIIHFRIQYFNPGIEDSSILEPIHRDLIRVFKLGEIIDLDEPPIAWGNGKTPSLQKVKQPDLDKVNAFAPRTDFIISIRIEHEYNPILGGLIHGGRHVLRLKCVLFDRQGKRLSMIKLKESCCATIGKSAEENEDPMSASEFLELYRSIVKRAFEAIR